MSSHQDNIFPLGSRMGSPGTAEGMEMKKNLAGRKTLSPCHWISWASIRTSVFFIRTQDGITRHNYKCQTENVWQVEKHLSSFYWIWWGAIRTSFFPLGPRMGSQGTTQGTWTGNVWQVKQPGRVFIECDEVSSGHNFFHAGPGWDPKGRPKGWKHKMSDK